jgi:hypothetical protein
MHHAVSAREDVAGHERAVLADEEEAPVSGSMSSATANPIPSAGWRRISLPCRKFASVRCSPDPASLASMVEQIVGRREQHPEHEYDDDCKIRRPSDERVMELARLAQELAPESREAALARAFDAS